MFMQQVADFASEVLEDKFSLANIQRFLLRYRQSPATAVQNAQEQVEQKCYTTRENPLISKEFCNNNEIKLSDKLNISPTAEDSAEDRPQSKEMAGALVKCLGDVLSLLDMVGRLSRLYSGNGIV